MKAKLVGRWQNLAIVLDKADAIDRAAGFVAYHKYNLIMQA